MQLTHQAPSNAAGNQCCLTQCVSPELERKAEKSGWLPNSSTLARLPPCLATRLSEDLVTAKRSQFLDATVSLWNKSQGQIDMESVHVIGEHSQLQTSTAWPSASDAAHAATNCLRQQNRPYAAPRWRTHTSRGRLRYTSLRASNPCRRLPG